MTSRLQAGLYVVQLARLNASNYPIGQLLTPDTPVNGTVYSPYVVPAPVSYDPETPTYAETSSYARMKQRGRLPLGVTDLGTGTFTLSEYDDDFNALVYGGTKDTTTAAERAFSTGNFARNTPRRFLVGLTPAALTYDSVLSYDTIWKWGYFTRGALGANIGADQNPNNRVHTFHPVFSTRTPFGQLFSAATVAPDNNIDSEYVTSGLYPDALTTYVDNGSGTSILQAYTPYYSEVAGDYNVFYKNGADNKANVASLSTKTWTVTAGAAGDIWCILTPSQEILSLAA